MAMHAKSGGNLEIMGMLQGKVIQDTFIVIDVFALPVEGTETRVNAQAEAYEYIVDFAETGKVRLHAVRPALDIQPAGAALLMWLLSLPALAFRKLVGWRIWLAGTTVILATAVGCQALTWVHKQPSRCIKNLSWL